MAGTSLRMSFLTFLRSEYELRHLMRTFSYERLSMKPRGSKCRIFEVSESRSHALLGFYPSWILEPETFNNGYLDPLGESTMSVKASG